MSSKQSMKSNIEAPTAKGISFFTVEGAITIGAIAALQPTINNVLKMLEPITLPTAISGVPLIADIRLTNISGAEVPAATIVRPITISGTRMPRANEEAPSVRRSAPHTTKATPTMMNTMLSSSIIRY